MEGYGSYLPVLQALLPTGPIWTRRPGAVLTRLLQAFADGLERVELAAVRLLDEMDPGTAVDLLEDWERVLGLPDSCTPRELTIPARQQAASQKYWLRGGGSPQFFVALAARLGFEVVIHEFDPGVATYEPGLDVSGGKWRQVWRVEVLTEVDYRVFRVGSRVDDRLSEGDVIDLECVFRRLKPAHTHVIFTYPES